MIHSRDHEALRVLVPRRCWTAFELAGDMDSGDVYDLLTEAGIVRREPYDPENPEHAACEEMAGSETGDEIWILTALGHELAAGGAAQAPQKEGGLVLEGGRAKPSPKGAEILALLSQAEAPSTTPPQILTNAAKPRAEIAALSPPYEVRMTPARGARVSVRARWRLTALLTMGLTLLRHPLGDVEIFLKGERIARW